MLSRKHYLLLCLCLLVSVLAFNQELRRHSIFSYNVNDGLLQSTIADLAVDGNNFCWISFPNGLQRFNGQDFVTIPSQPGLPNDQFIKFFRCKSGNMLMSHLLGISLYNRHNNQFKLLVPATQKLSRPAIFIGEYNGKVYALSEKGMITELKEDGTFINWKGEWPAPDSLSETAFMSAQFPGSGKAVFSNCHKRLCYVDLASGTVSTHPLPAEISPYLLGMISPKEAVIQFEDSLYQLHVYDFEKRTMQPYFPEPVRSGILARSCIYQYEGRVLIGGGHDVAEVDTENRRIHHKKVNFQNESVGGSSGIGKMCLDNFGNIYVATIFSGIRKIMSRNLPIKYFGSAKENSNFVLSVLPDKKQNRVLVGTNQSGLYVYDTLQNLIKHFTHFPGTTSPLSVNGIFKTPLNEYLLIPANNAKALLLSNSLEGFRPLEVRPDPAARFPGFNFFGNPVFQDSNGAIMQTQGNLYFINYKNLFIQERTVSDNYIMSGLYHRGRFIYHDNDELIFADPVTWRKIKKVPLPNTGYVRCYTTDNSGRIHAGTNKGIFIMDGNGRVVHQLNKEHGLPDECIYAMVVDKRGDLWCSSNKGIFRVNADGTFFQLKKEDGLQENEFNTNVAAIADDGEVFFGGVNGVSSFYPSGVIRQPGLPELMINGLQVNHTKKFQDTAVWQIDDLEIAHDENFIVINFMAKGPDNPDQYIYQYRMLGFNDEWIVHEGQRTVRYFLPPGKYTFQLFASRNFTPAPFPLKEIRISVSPPFYKTWWFLLICSAALLALVIYVVNNINRRKYAQHLDEIRRRHALQVQRETISRDLHDNIGVYANAVLYHTEQLQNLPTDQARQGLLRDLQFASRDILLSLRETIWAFKKSTYTATECWLRLRNFLQPIYRYYPHIRFVQEGSVPEDRSYNYQSALNLVRVVQEAVTNALKHGEPSVVQILSEDAGYGKWRIVVKDDGKGFDVNAEPSGDGLKNMQKRAKEGNLLV
ncbi:MAG: hypothetical protein EOP49_01125, partial [Sphingobacteriales bacterium]